MTKDFSAVVLAAGKGTRFKSNKIKVLHQLLGKSMLHLVIDSLYGLDPEELFVIVGYQKERIMKEEFAYPVRFAIQKKPLGTADAVWAVKDLLKDQKEKNILVMNADLPLVRTETLRPFFQFHQQENNDLTFLTGELENPTGFGRVIPGVDNVIRIVEEKDATPLQRKIKESNLGVYCFDKKELFNSIPKISNKNVKREYYLTDIIEIMIRDGKKCAPFRTENTEEFIGVNDRDEFEMAAEVLRKRKLQLLGEEGVICLDKQSCWIDMDVTVGRETVIHSDVVIEGSTVIGSQCRIHPHVRIKDSFLGERVHVHESAVLESCLCEDGSQIGPSMHVVNQKILEGHILKKRNTDGYPGNGKNRGGT